ncbi:hypothetical protein ACLOJK_006549, partial [Asimina triloba]
KSMNDRTHSSVICCLHFLIMSVATQIGISTSSAAVVCTYMVMQSLLLIEHHGRLDRSLWTVAIEWVLTGWKGEDADISPEITPADGFLLGCFRPWVQAVVVRSGLVRTKIAGGLDRSCWSLMQAALGLEAFRIVCVRRSPDSMDLDGGCRPLARIRSLLPVCDRMGFSTGKMLDLEFQIRTVSSMIDLELLIVAADGGSLMG